MKTLSHRIQYLLLILSGTVLAALPRRLFYGVAKYFSLFVYHILGIRRQVALDNIRLAFGDTMTAQKMETICRDSYVNIGTTMLEMLLVPHLKGQILNMIAMPGLGLLQRTLAKNRGVIFVAAHFGTWELSGAAVAAAGIPITVVGARLSNRYIDSYIRKYRSALGMEVVHPFSSSIKPLVKAIKDKKVIGLISDQDAGPNYSVFVDFFGRPAATPTGAAQLAIKYRVPLLTGLAVRTGPGRYQLRFEEVEVAENDSVGNVTQKYTAIIEEYIRKYPEQYFWMHRRWKTRPKAEVSSGD